MKTLILTDVQRDFMPGGPLGIPGADAIIPIINRLIPAFDHVIATLDWHPPQHVSFASAHDRRPGERVMVHGVEQILWRDHCIQNTKGAGFADGLHQERIEAIFHKGSDLGVDSYSTFFDNARKRETGLGHYLQKRKLKDLYFVGVATDYCVLYSVLDALELGFHVWVIKDACCAINLREGDEERAMQKMMSQGARLIHSSGIG